MWPIPLINIIMLFANLVSDIMQLSSIMFKLLVKLLLFLLLYIELHVASKLNVGTKVQNKDDTKRYNRILYTKQTNISIIKTYKNENNEILLGISARKC